MPAAPFTLIEAGRPVSATATLDGDKVRITPESLAATLGWQLEPEGLCRGEVCVPVADASLLRDPAGIDLEALAAVLQRPLALDREERVAVLGVSAAERGRSLASGLAPDFTLPDLQGRSHSLSDQRGKKVLLVAYASW